MREIVVSPIGEGERRVIGTRAISHDALDFVDGWKLVVHDVVEAAEECLIENLPVVRGGDDDALGGICLYELQERVQDAAHLANLVVSTAVGSYGVELVEQVDGTVAGDGIEDLPKPSTGLAKVLRDELVACRSAKCFAVATFSDCSIFLLINRSFASK